jgi:TonB family protein
MIIGEGRSVTIAVVVTVFVLFLLLIVTIVMGIEDYGPRIWTALGGRTVPVPDRSLAGAKLTLTGNPAAFFSNDAYPAEAIRTSQQGRTVALLHVDVTGSPSGCNIVSSSGSASLDSTTCSILMRHATFHPARDANGVAIPGDFPVPVRWVLPQD